MEKGPNLDQAIHVLNSTVSITAEASMADLSYEVDSSHHATITVRGEIAAGDAERFEQLAERVCQKHLTRELPCITAALD
jgi:hypothetical protein